MDQISPNELHRPKLKLVNGIRVCAQFSDTALKQSLNYLPADDQVVLCSFPRSGTYWTRQILLCILTRCDPEVLGSAQRSFALFPFIDLLGIQPEVDEKPLGVMTHIPFSRIRYNPNAKYVYVCRNPKDVAVSLFNFLKSVSGYQFTDAKWSDFIVQFAYGELQYGDWFEHVASWWSANKSKTVNNVYIVTYEQIRTDPKAEITKLAEFLGKEHIEYVKDNLDEVIHYSSFEYMKSNFLDPEKLINQPRYMEILRNVYDAGNSDEQKDDNSSHHTPKTKVTFIRKGVINDWRNYFTDNDNQVIATRFIDTDKKYGISEIWKNPNWL